MSDSINDTYSDSVNQTATNVADAVFDKTARLIVLYIQIVLGAVGSTLVCAWLLINRRRTSRINTIIRNLACADILVISFACVMQVYTRCDNSIHTLLRRVGSLAEEI